MKKYFKNITNDNTQENSNSEKITSFKKINYKAVL